MRQILVLILIIWASQAFSQYIIQRTVTINEQTLTDMRSSMNNQTSQYYDNFLDISRNISREASVDEERDRAIIIPTCFWTIFNSTYNLKYSLFSQLTQLQEDNLSDINNLLGSITNDNISSLMNYFRNTDVGSGTRALRLVYLSINVSLLYDCLYYAPSQYISQQNKDKLKTIMLACVNLMQETEVDYSNHGSDPLYCWVGGLSEAYPYPRFPLIQYRFAMYGGMGLTALILRQTDASLAQNMTAIINDIDTKLLTTPLPPVFPNDFQKQGMFSFHTTYSGAYFESLGYQSFLMALLTSYFTAYKRITNGAVNYYNNPDIASWMKDITLKSCPNYDNWNYNDTGYINGYLPNGLVDFFYNAGDQCFEIKRSIAWYIKLRTLNSNSPPNITSNGYVNCGFMMLYNSNPYASPKLPDIDYVPPEFYNGSWSNSEFTILRKPSSPNYSVAANDMVNNPAMYICHENTFSGYHNHADQTSYAFYYKGKNFFIDPGYKNWSISRNIH